ncbi:hypothetical protein OIU85_019844 [Salix viminalis]|uniref:Uncharacterized protein n=1 Tax=Salix viminalis TaxID=40686 RepID=A0A9Q0NHZ4_SALVM|nr:hypothetical protein OIU85_019844 [Salix viminalis]
MKERPRKPTGRPGKGQLPALPKQRNKKRPKAYNEPRRATRPSAKTKPAEDKTSPPKRSLRPLEQPKGTTPQTNPPQKAKPQPAITGSRARPDRNYSSGSLLPQTIQTLTEYSSDFEGIPASHLSPMPNPKPPSTESLASEPEPSEATLARPSGNICIERRGGCDSLHECDKGDREVEAKVGCASCL